MIILAFIVGKLPKLPPGNRALISSVAAAVIDSEISPDAVLSCDCPIALADILWSLFSGIILWEESKRSINNEKNYLTPTLQTGFEIFINGITKHS